MVSNLNMDFAERVKIETASLDWVASPLPGVERKMLERENPESGRATSVVRYAPGSAFSPHVHSGGEEFVVLEGVFSDEYGDFGPGSYVRNPIGSEHEPRSEPGCTIFVKLCQFSPDDQTFVRLQTDDQEWLPGQVEGLTVKPLHQFETEQVALVKWAPGTHFQRHTHFGGEEIFVMEGTFEDEHGSYPAGTWLRSPHGSSHTPFSTDGCIIYVKVGHLG